MDVEGFRGLGELDIKDMGFFLAVVVEVLVEVVFKEGPELIC